jgi:hypothetical protein
MTLTLDAEQVFWWLAGAGVLIAVWCLLADTALNAVRLVLSLDSNRPRRVRAERSQSPD